MSDVIQDHYHYLIRVTGRQLLELKGGSARDYLIAVGFGAGGKGRCGGGRVFGCR